MTNRRDEYDPSIFAPGPNIPAVGEVIGFAPNGRGAPNVHGKVVAIGEGYVEVECYDTDGGPIPVELSWIEQ